MNSMVESNNFTLCNDGSVPLRVPGFSDLCLRHEVGFEHRFSTPFDLPFQPNITARELAVLCAINAITDKDGWAEIILRDDPQQMARYRAEAEANSELINEQSWHWILRELHDKARAFVDSKGVLVFDSGAVGIAEWKIDDPNPGAKGVSDFSGFAVYKSDCLTSPLLLAELKQCTRSFFESEMPHGANYQVNPSMYPLVFNRTPVLTGKGETVSLHNFASADNQYGSIAPVVTRWPEKYEWVTHYSTIFQWLPCEVEFRDLNQVAITSYINNLDPIHFYDLYRTIETVISLTIEPWNEVVVEAGRGRTPLRILTYGVEYSPRRLYGRLPWLRDENLLRDEAERASAIEYIEKYYALPGHFGFEQDGREEDVQRYNWKKRWENSCWPSGYSDRLHSQWAQYRTCPSKHPQMGQALTYDAWKSGDIGACVIPSMDCKDVNATSDSSYIFKFPPPISLQNKFSRQGLQIIVKLASIELTPVQPKYAGSEWAIEGTANEHIVAVTSLCYSVENVINPQIAFLHTGYMDCDAYDYDPQDLEDLEEVLALDNEPEPGYERRLDSYEGGQMLGTVNLRPGRLLAYPNHLMTKMEEFELENKTRPGHVRSLILCLVDPHYRICSTRNVFPQQPEYWFDQALQTILPERISLPVEIKDMIRGYSESWPISALEAATLSKQERKLYGLRQHQEWGTCHCGA